jgi:hypothetical protein
MLGKRVKMSSALLGSMMIKDQLHAIPIGWMISFKASLLWRNCSRSERMAIYDWMLGWLRTVDAAFLEIKMAEGKIFGGVSAEAAFNWVLQYETTCIAKQHSNKVSNQGLPTDDNHTRCFLCAEGLQNKSPHRRNQLIASTVSKAILEMVSIILTGSGEDSPRC